MEVELNPGQTQLCPQKNVTKCQAQLSEGDNTSFDESLEHLIRNIAKTEGFVCPSIDRQLICNKGGNFLGILYKVTIKDNVGDKTKILHLFVKVAVPADSVPGISIHDIYSREMFAYEKLAPMYSAFQSEANVPENELYKFVKFYGVLRQESAETIIMENLMVQGYDTIDRMEPMSLYFAQIAIKNLARFHALSFVMQRKNLDYHQKFIKTMKHPISTDDENWDKFAITMHQKAIDVMETSEQKRKLEMFRSTLQEKSSTMYEHGNRPVLCHGDYRISNIMVQMKEERILSMLAVDYQLIHYGSPFIDIYYLIFCATDEELRRKHLDSLLNLYYKTLASFLKYFSIDIDEVFPRAEFDEEAKEMLVYGLILTIQVLPFLLVVAEEAPELGVDLGIPVATNTVYTNRVRGVINDFIRWGYL